MQVRSDSFQAGTPIPGEFAFGVPHPTDPMALGPNRNPHLAWSDVPENARSFVVVCSDPDVPTVPDDVNQEGRTVPADLPRTDFCHWVLVDVPGEVSEIGAGAFGSGIVPGGKTDAAPFGRQGINDYTTWFAGDPDMEGDYFGYDGPCPPWNDSIVHHYGFRVLALDVDTLDVAGAFTASEALAAAEGHVLDEATIVGTYSLNPDVPG